MLNVTPLTDSTSLIGDPEALRQRWEDDGVLFLRSLVPLDLIDWARQKFREALANEELVDPTVEAPIWTGEAPQTRRPCDALGTEVWHEFIKLPQLNDILRIAFDDDPVWIPIAGHRSSMPTGPIAEGQDLFAGRHQDGYFNEGIPFATCWMPLRDFDQSSGSFAVAPATHKRGNLHSESDHRLPADAIPDEAWRSTDFRVGDVLIFHYFTAHATLPNPSNLIRMSLDVRAIPGSGAQPVVGTVDKVEGTHVTIVTDAGETVCVHVTDATYIRDMDPRPRVPTEELERIAYPGARIMAMAGNDRNATVLRRSFY